MKRLASLLAALAVILFGVQPVLAGVPPIPPPAPSPAAYTGFVATRGYLRNGVVGSGVGQYYNARSQHVARDNITSLQVVQANWYVDTTTKLETNVPGTATRSMSVEYPVGVFTPILTGGQASSTSNPGDTVVSDATAVSIPKGAVFWIREYYRNSSGIHFITGPTNDMMADGYEFGTGTGTNKTATGTINTGSGAWAQPVAIIGTTKLPSVLIVMDSRGLGWTDPPTDDSRDAGDAARSIGPYLAYSNISIQGDTLQAWLASSTKRAALAQYATHAVLGLGINDAGTRTAAQMIADDASMVARFPTLKVYYTTMPPMTTSSDSWATVANQTVNANNTVRIAVNNARRAGVPGSLGTFDVADAVEDSFNGGKWAVIGGALTGDGTHANNRGSLTVKRSRAVMPELFTR